MHALIEDGAVKQYPYGIFQLKKDNPNSSFPKNPGDELLASFGVQRVFFSTPLTVTDEQVLEEQTPVFDTEAQRWTQNWSVREMSAEEIKTRTAQQWQQVREQRNELLAACDWKQLPDAPVDQVAWATYRQSLRDITDQADPFAIVWPAAP